MRWRTVSGAVGCVLSMAEVAGAQTRAEPLVLIEPAVMRRPEEQPHFTLALTYGALEHGTTGTPAGYGYDGGTAMSLGVNSRLVFPLRGCRCMTHGVDANLLWSDGTTLGVGGESAWTRAVVDFGYAFRVELPCLRSGTRRWWVTGTVGMSGQWADAGLGDVATSETAGANERMAAAQRYDHVALGWHAGASMEVVFDKALVGFGVDLRDLRGIDTDQARTFLLGVNLRAGFDLGL